MMTMVVMMKMMMGDDDDDDDDEDDRDYNDGDGLMITRIRKQQKIKCNTRRGRSNTHQAAGCLLYTSPSPRD